MSTSSTPVGRISMSVGRIWRLGRGRWRWPVIVAVCAAAAVLLSLLVSTPPASVHKKPLVVSYAGAASWLRGLEPADAQEQLRDWARTALAAHLEMNTATLRDALYDTVPVRDLAFADRARQPMGPGRALYDGVRVLHVLVPRDDPHKDRTIGLLIDQHLLDAGADPAQVQVHQYQMHPENLTIELTSEEPAPTSDVRSAHGYLTMRVDQMTGLTDFLSQTSHLSWLEVRGSETWAGGWRWPDVPSAPLDLEDVSAIQRGYRQPSSSSEQSPGFSLDPKLPETEEDLVAVLSGTSEKLLDRLVTDNWAGSRFRSVADLVRAIEDALYKPGAPAEPELPTDRTQLWALLGLIKGHPIYSEARYEGGLAGTKVGMTLFYTDHIAKNWVAGIGTGVPSKAVPGFVADPDAMIPWSHCPGPKDALSESGRLWFGQSESGFAFDSSRVLLGAQATRLFARSDSDGGTEVEPSFGFGRGLRWWDQHYQAVADYEPQYQRLDQIMRWSGAIEWLVAKTPARLPQLEDSAIRSYLRFKDWYARNDQLRERSPIEFVSPPTARHEAVLHKPSNVYKECGHQLIQGGVSLGDLTHRMKGRTYHADLPGPARRGGLYAESSKLDPATGKGAIEQVSIDAKGEVVDTVTRTLSTTSDGHALVDVAATGRRVSPLGALKVWLTERASRRYKVELAGEKGTIWQRVEFQGQGLGQLVATKKGATVTIHWHSGLVDRVLQLLEAIQKRLGQRPAGGPAGIEVLYSVVDGSGRTQYRIAGPDLPWLRITSEQTPPGEDLSFRIGGPAPGTGEPAFHQAHLVPGPGPGSAGWPKWFDVTPPTADHPAQIVAATAPGNDAIRVTTPDGRTASIYRSGTNARAPWADPIVGIDGLAEAAALMRDFPRVDKAMRSAAQAGDGQLRGILLGDDGIDGVALVGADGVHIAPADHQWADTVRRATVPDGPDPLIVIDNDRAFHAAPLTGHPDGASRRFELSDLMEQAKFPMYLSNDFYHNLQSQALFEDGVLIASRLPHDIKVTVREVVLTADPSLKGPAPDVYLQEGTRWWRAGNGTGGGGAGSAADTAVRILLVCQDTDQADEDCGD
jgi:hypothetical protein